MPKEPSLFAWQGFFVMFICEHNISHTIIHTGISLYCEIDRLRFSDGHDSGADPGGIGIHTQKLKFKKKKEKNFYSRWMPEG